MGVSPTNPKQQAFFLFCFLMVDVEGFSHPRRSTPSSRPQVPPKPVASDRLKKAEQNLILSNQFSALSDDEMDSSPISPD